MKTKVEILAPNHLRIVTREGVYFQSYDSIIVFIPSKGKIQLGKNWDYSKTTGKYRNKFLNETKKETAAKLKSGEYILNENL